MDTSSYTLGKEEDIVLCFEEIAKLISFLRCTDKYSDVSKPMALWPRDPVVTTVGIPSPVATVSAPQSENSEQQYEMPQISTRSTPVSSYVVASSASGTNTLAKLVDLYTCGNRQLDAMQILAPIIAIVRDPGISGHVTAEALGSVLRIMECGSREVFLENFAILGFIIDSVTRTRFTETDRDNDETVLLRIIDIIQLGLTRGSVDKTRVASGLQCIQTIWIHEFHSSALRDAARRAVFRILKTAIVDTQDGFDGYAQTLMDNISLNIELLVRQPNATFDADKLGFFVDVLGLMISSSNELTTFQINNALFWLIPAGPAAVVSDNTSHGVLTRNSSALSISSGLLAIGNHLIRENLISPSKTSAITVEALISSMYIRGLLPVEKEHDHFAFSLFFPKKGQVLSPLVAAGGYHKVSDSVSGHMALPMVQPIQATLLESLLNLCQIPQLLLSLFESFDSVWHRSEICSQLIDSVIAIALHHRVIAVPKEKDGETNNLRRYLEAFHAYGTSGDVTIDPSALVPTYTECLTMDVLRRLVSSCVVPTGHADRRSPRTAKQQTFEWQQRTRAAAKETAKHIKNKPKKAHEFVENFLNEFSVHPPSVATNSLAWALRVNPYIDFETLGEFFGQPTEISSKALSEFIKSLNLKIMDPEEALRSCLQAFRLPGEAQQIDRIIKEIAYEYYASHSDLSEPGNYFASADAAYTFLFSVIMLNTDQHNPQVKKRMELKDFLRNNRKINEGEDIPEDVQTRVFNSIRASQIVTPKSSSWFCCPLKARWRDLYYMSSTGFIPNQLGTIHSDSVANFIKTKGSDILIAASYMLARDPNRYTCAVEVITGLIDLAACQDDVESKKFATEAIGVLRRYALKSFATNISGISPTNRSFACLRALFGIQSSLDSLLEAVAVMLGYWSTYSLMLGSDQGVPTMKDSWSKILSLPVLDPAAVAGGAGAAGSSGTSSGISSIFRGLLNPLYESEVPTIDNRSETPVIFQEDDMSPTDAGGSNIEKRFSVDSFGDLSLSTDWRSEVLRTSFMDNSPNAPPAKQLLALKQVEIDKVVHEIVSRDGSKTSAIILMMLELIAHPNRVSTDEFWPKELVRSSPWILLQCLRMLNDSPGSDLLASAAAKDAVIAVLRHYESNNLLSDIRGLKVVIFSAFAFLIVFSQRDPTGEIVDPSSWILPVLDEMSTLCSKSQLMLGLGPIVCICIRTLLMEAPAEWVGRLGTSVWRELFRLISLVCPPGRSSKTPEVETTKKICHESALIVLVNHKFLNAFATAANAANDMSECIVSFEKIISSNRGSARVCKHLTDLACKFAGMASYGPGVGVAWTAIVGRITVRVTGVTKQKKPTGNELSDVVELLRMCLGDPRAVQIVTPAQAGATIEKCASTLTSVVSSDTPPGALQAALCVFTRFFLLCLDKLIQHPQFDHLWLMSLRVILLFIKRGHDDPSMEQLAEITTETLRNALQVLVASRILQLPSDDETRPVWWKVTWEIVETFCPGMIEELVSPHDQNTPPEDSGRTDSSPKQLEAIPEHEEAEVTESHSPNPSMVI